MLEQLIKLRGSKSVLDHLCQAIYRTKSLFCFFTPKHTCFLLSWTVRFCVKQFTHSFLHFSPSFPHPTIWNCWALRTGAGDIKTSRSKGEKQQTQRSYSVTFGEIQTQGTLMGCAPRSALHLRFPIEKKKNFSFTRHLFYRLLGH